MLLIGRTISPGIGTQRLDKLQSEYEHQKNNLLETWDKDEFDLNDGQDRSEFKLKLIIYIQDREFQSFKKTKELQRATAKNDARLEVSLALNFYFIREKKR